MKKTPLQRKTALKRTSSLRNQSARTAARSGERRAVAERALATYGPCALSGLGGCWGPTDAHELVRRSSMRGVAYDDRFVVTLCRAHHDIDDADPARAERLGIRIVRWAWDRCGEATLEEAARLRELANAGSLGVPFWRDEGWTPDGVQ